MAKKDWIDKGVDAVARKIVDLRGDANVRELEKRKPRSTVAGKAADEAMFQRENWGAKAQDYERKRPRQPTVATMKKTSSGASLDTEDQFLTVDLPTTDIGDTRREAKVRRGENIGKAAKFAAIGRRFPQNKR